MQDACPEVCGRRCRRRIRACHGPFHLVCSGQGKAEEFDDCPALNNPTTGFQRSTLRYTTRSRDDFERYREDSFEYLQLLMGSKTYQKVHLRKCYTKQYIIFTGLLQEVINNDFKHLKLGL